MMRPSTFLFALTLAGCNRGGDTAAGAPVAGAPVGEAASDSGDGGTTISASQFAASGYAVGSPSERSFETAIEVRGSLELPPDRKEVVSPYIAGAVSGLNSIEGERVRAGQVLFRVSSPELIGLQQRYLEARGQLAYLTTETARQRELVAAEISAGKNYSKSQADLQLAEATEAGLAEQLTLLGIDPAGLTPARLSASVAVRASRPGVIAAVHIANGQTVGAGAPALEIARIDDLHLELAVLERDASRVREGQEVRFRVPADTAARLAEVHLISPTIDGERRAHIHCDVRSGQGVGLLPGMYVTAEVVLGEERRLALPEEAVVEVEGSQFILVRDAGDTTRYERKLVRAGAPQAGYVPVELPADVDSSAAVLVRGAYYVL